jgi:hypothetical protein
MMNEWITKAARAIMLARDNGGCIVVDWEAEERDNPHVEQALRQARAAVAELLPLMKAEMAKVAWDYDGDPDDSWWATAGYIAAAIEAWEPQA